jgi:hypothetical protein
MSRYVLGERMNERLRSAMARAQVTPYDVAKKTRVDPKTVQRWLSGRVPHQRHRWAVAEYVGEDEAYLWPSSEHEVGAGANSTTELVAAYAHRSDAPSSLWTNLIDGARSHVDVLGYAVQFLPETYAGLGDRLVAKAESGCIVRIAVADPESPDLAARDAEEGLDGGLIHRVQTTLKHLAPVVASPQTEVRFHRTPMYNSVFRFDDQLLLTPHLYGRPGYQASMLHLRRVGAGGMFDNYAKHFDDVWNSATAAT